MKRTIALFAIVFATAACAASAASLENTPFYGAISGSRSTMNPDTTGLDSFDKKATGFGIAMGMQVHPNVAIEFGYASYGNRMATITAPGGMAIHDAVDLSAFGVHAVMSTKVSDAVSVFVKPGIINATVGSFGYTRQSTSKTQFNVGAGAEYAVTPNIGVYAIIDRTNNFGGSNAALTTTSFGVRIHH